MSQHTEAITATCEVEQACRHYLRQVRAVMPLNGLAVVMLDTSEDTGRVVFSWRDSPTNVSPSNLSLSGNAPTLEIPSVMNITLYGSDGSIGGILLHTSAADGFSKLHRRIAQDLSAQLEMRLENAQLNQRLRATSSEISLLDEVTHIVSRCLDLEEAFGPLVTAVGKAVEIDVARLSWIDFNGYEIHTLVSRSGPTELGGLEVETPIVYCQEIIAALKFHRAERPFSTWERGLLEMVCNQIAPAVHGTRYHHSIKSQSPGLGYHTHTKPKPQQEHQSSAEERPESSVDLAHALCTPLTTIKGYANSLLQPGVDWPPGVQQEFLSTIDQAADRLGKVIRELLSPAQAGQATMKCQYAVADLGDLLDGVESELCGDVTDAPVQFRCQAVLPLVSIDRHLVQRAIRHLIDCFLITMIPGETLLVEASQSSDGPTISITVSSNYQHQRDASQLLPRGDTDLRVIACRNILEAHSVRLNVDTTYDGDPRFWFTLPPAESA